MNILFASSDRTYVEWAREAIFNRTVDFACNNPVKATLIACAAGAIAFSYLDPEDAIYLTHLAQRQLNSAHQYARPYLDPVLEKAGSIYDGIATKLTPICNEISTLFYETAKEVKPYIQGAESWLRSRFCRESTVLERWIPHINWKGSWTWGEPTVLTRLSHYMPIHFMVDTAGIIPQYLFLNAVVPKLVKKSPTLVAVSTATSHHYFGPLSSVVPIE